MLWMLSRFSHGRLLSIPWTIARCQTPQSMRFSRQEYWSGLLCPSLGDLPDPGIKPTSLMSPALADGFFTVRATWEAGYIHTHTHIYMCVCVCVCVCVNICQSVNWSIGQLINRYLSCSMFSSCRILCHLPFFGVSQISPLNTIFLTF